MAIALYDVDPVSGEATGKVYHFCSVACRDNFPCPSNEDLVFGQSDDYVAGTVCDECAKPLPDEPVAG